MKKKGQFNTQLSKNIMYILFFLVFFSALFYFILRYQNGVVVWEEFYASEIANLINNAEPGSEIILDVSLATELAFKSGIRDFNSIFNFNNEQNIVSVTLGKSGGTSYSFFNNVEVREWRVEEAYQGTEINRLVFLIGEKR